MLCIAFTRLEVRLLAMTWCVAGLSAVGLASAQTAGWNGPAALDWPTAVAAPMPVSAYQTTSSGDSRHPLARLVRNPDSDRGLPPFALTDQAGAIQRFVEPVPGIDLNPYVNQVISVRHDTGRTLLATQLELPPRPLMPLIGDSVNPRGTEFVPARDPGFPVPGALRLAQNTTVQSAQSADNDDATVQLLQEPQEAQEAGENSRIRQNAPRSTEKPSLGEELPRLSAGSNAPDVPGELDPLDERLFSGPRFSESCTNPWESIEPCPECGRYHLRPQLEPGDDSDFLVPSNGPPSQLCRLFADVEFNFLRTHLESSAIGKLSEEYQLSPRVIIGFRETGILDGRARYWHYDRATPVLDGSGRLRIQFDVLDLEGTHRFLGRRSEVLLAGGFRIASIDLTDVDDERSGGDLLGMTFAAEGRSALGSFQGGYFTIVYGGRLSILGGDWGAESGSDFLSGRMQDDNLLVHELSAGVDYAVRHRDFNIHARLAFEMQNWHSDVLSPTSIGIIGPGIQFGAEF